MIRKSLSIMILVLGAILFFKVVSIIEDYLRIPANRTWMEVQQEIFRDYLAGDGMTFSPDWLGGYATDLDRFKFMEKVKLRDLEKGKADRPENLWLISKRAQPKIIMGLEEAGYQKMQEYGKAGLYLTKLNDTRNKVIYDFVANIAVAESWIDWENGARVKGAVTNKTHDFGDGLEWNQIESKVVTYDFGQRATNAIWLHPVENGTKNLRFDLVPTGDRLNLFLGLADTGRRYDKERTCFVRVLVNDRVVEDIKINEKLAWQNWNIDMQDQDTAVAITFQTDCQEDVTRRHLFVKARMMEDEGKSA